jgi:adenosylcobyric acid synthase
MFMGTGSDVGKSLIVAGLCRLFARRGLKVRPFKPQNMSNNAAVTADGGEIGRAQALQARAAGVPLSVHMNPVLLKPQSEIGSQIIVQGKIHGAARAREYQAIKPTLLPAVMDSFARLRSEADLVIVEGAGSASEVNLRANDIANMGFAEAAGLPVVLIGDIDRGGVIASLVGTQTVAVPADAARIKGFLVNKMRGDPSLFDDGMRFVAQATGWAPLGLVPYFDKADRLPAEDVLGLKGSARTGDGKVVVAVPVLPRISNFDDLDPLRLEPHVDVRLVRRGEAIPGDAALVLLPGSKATIADLAAFREAGFDIDLKAHVRRGGRVLGLCGGFQMLGRSIADPDGIEGPAGTVAGLGLLDVETVLTGDKTLTEVTGVTVADEVPFHGYEMHVGRTSGPDAARPFARLASGTLDGATSVDGRVAGGYVHGLFADDRQRAAWLARLGAEAGGFSYEADVEATLDTLADHLAAHCDIEAIWRLSSLS